MPDVIYNPIDRLHGIGRSIAASLKNFGFHDAEDLLRNDRIDVSRQIAAVDGITFDRALTDFLPQARLLRTGMSVKSAVSFIKEGITDYRRFVRLDLEKIQEIGQAESDEPVSIEVAGEWLVKAAARVGTGTVHLSVRSMDGAPVVDAKVEILDPTDRPGNGVWSWKTNANGVVFIESTLPGYHTAIVSHSGFSDASILFESIADGHSGVVIILRQGNSVMSAIDEFRGQLLTDFSLPMRRIKLASLSDLPFVPVLHVIGVNALEAEVASVLFRRIRNHIELYWLRIDIGKVPNGIKAGDFLYDDNGSLKIAGFATMDDARKAWESTFHR